MTKLRFNRYEVVSFITGFCLLTYELAAARVLAPSVGSSTYVWTSVIGVIIAALAFGFWAGGKLADSRNRASDLAVLLCIASFGALVTLLFYPAILEPLKTSQLDVRLLAVYAAVVLFAPTSFVIGMTSPYIAKLNIRSLKTTGQKIASIDALNSVGGIFGTFLTGFVLFGFIGSRQTFVAVIVLLLLASWLIAPSFFRARRLWFSAAVLLASTASLTNISQVIAIDTPSSHYEIQNYTYRDGTPIRGLTTGPSGIQSAVRLDGSSQPVFWYAKEMTDIITQRQPERILMLGGGAFTVPQYLSQVLPDSQIDVVEIDPELASISRQYFNFTDPDNVRVVSDDARRFVNQATQPYDMILIDVYGDASIPFSLMTKEYGQKIGELVKEDGVLLANIIAGTSGPCLDVLNAMNGAYTQRLPVARYTFNPQTDPSRTNMLAWYGRQPTGFGTNMPGQPSPYDDNYAPAERLYYNCEQVK